ncbi:MAG TPA: DUF438 domain-containing protein [Chthonomonadales bacterium]|nr:DUF438 domain-containing protein [Chthonomonadales bacterium]
MVSLSPNTTIHELLSAHPDLIEDLPAAYPEFAPLRDPVARAAMARVATLERAAGVARVPVEKLMADVAAMIARRASAGAPTTDPASDRSERVEALKRIIERLHAGGSLEEAQREFQAVAGDASAGEIAEMEQQLIRDGLPVQEIQRLCDVHVNVFRAGLDSQQPPEAPPGHPVHTYMAENREIERRANAWVDACRRTSGHDAPAWEELGAALESLAAVDLHYTRKEHQLFPALEAQGFTGPSRVMWGVHDDIRARVRALRQAIANRDAAAVAAGGAELARQATEMVYKEERILFPTALSLLSEGDWVRMRDGDAAIGYLVEPEARWTPHSTPPAPDAKAAGVAGPNEGAPIALRTGALTSEQLAQILVTLPVEISFVDDQDVVRFYSDHPDRIFPRSPGDIGRAVQNCHPPSSLHIVQAILDAFRSGQRDDAKFWINFRGRLVMISYFAVRSEEGRYLGCMEVTQDVTDIRSLEGERRLLQWE